MRLDVTKKRCPQPLAEVRKALSSMSPGDDLEIMGFDPPSKEEILMLESGSVGIISSEEDEQGVWTIKLRRLRA